MKELVNRDCIESLQKPGAPIIIVAAVKEAEAIAYACKDFNINVLAFCDSEKRKSNETFCGLKVIHTPTLPKKYSNARFLIATQQIQDVVEQLSALGYKEFYSALELKDPLVSYHINYS